MKRLAFCLAITFFSFNALSEECQIKPVIKEFKPLETANFEYIVSYDLKFKTIQPQK